MKMSRGYANSAHEGIKNKPNKPHSGINGSGPTIVVVAAKALSAFAFDLL